MSAGKRASCTPPSLTAGDINQSAPQTLSSVLPVDLRTRKLSFRLQTDIWGRN